MSRSAMDTLTPMLRQYRSIKAQHPDAVLMFRLGDFYEMFYDDALLASKALSLTLTSRGRGTKNEAPMCGVPYHAADSYVARLIRQGHRVAICDQVEDPRVARGIVRRAVTRVVSPGTVTDPAQLRASEPNYIAAIQATGVPERGGAGDGFGVEGRNLAVGAAGALLHYLQEAHKADFRHVTRVVWHHPSEAMVLDATTRRTLEVAENTRDGGRDGTLLSILDRTETAMGG